MKQTLAADHLKTGNVNQKTFIADFSQRFITDYDSDDFIVN